MFIPDNNFSQVGLESRFVPIETLFWKKKTNFNKGEDPSTKKYSRYSCV